MIPSDQDIADAAASEGIRLHKIADGLFLIHNIGNFTATIGTNHGVIRVRLKTGKRWRTVGSWKRLPRALRAIKESVLP